MKRRKHAQFVLGHPVERELATPVAERQPGRDALISRYFAELEHVKSK
jgi:hypothetical protein